jgi:hypothetical protein
VLCLRQVDFFKIDAEGSELDVSRDSRRLLKGDSSKIFVVEYHESDDPAKFSVFLRYLGYKTGFSKDDFICAQR